MTTELRSFADQLEAIEHYQALGMTRAMIPREADDQPWEVVTSLRPGSSHRLDMATSINCEYEHPSGMTFFWFLEIEEEGSNGSSAYQIDTTRLGGIIARLPDGPRQVLCAYLLESAGKVETRGEEFMEGARRQFGDAAALRSLAREHAVPEPVG